MPAQQNAVEVLVERLDALKGDIERRFEETKGVLSEIRTSLTQEYVTRREIQPLFWITYGMVGLILTGFLGALIALVFKQ